MAPRTLGAAWMTSMTPHRRALDEFRETARRAFSCLLERGYREVPGDDERFAIEWSDDRTVLLCEGIHWGDDVSLRIGAADVLRGDHSSFARLTEDAERRLAAARAAEEQEHQRLRAEGWVDGEVMGMPALIPPPAKSPGK